MSESLHRLLALMLLLFLGIVAYWVIDQLWLGTYRYYIDNIEVFKDRQARFSAMAGQRPELEAKLQQVRQDSSVDAHTPGMGAGTVSSPSSLEGERALHREGRSRWRRSGGTRHGGGRDRRVAYMAGSLPTP